MQLTKGRVLKPESFRSTNDQYYFHVKLLSGEVVVCKLGTWLVNFLLSSVQINKSNYVIISEHMASYLKKRGHYAVIADNIIVGITTNRDSTEFSLANLNGKKYKPGYWIKKYLGALKALTFMREDLSTIAANHFKGCEAIIENGKIVGIIQNFP